MRCMFSTWVGPLCGRTQTYEP